MGSFELLEKKVTHLISIMQKLKDENAALSKENSLLKKRLSVLEEDVLQGNESLEVLHTEKEKAKLFVTDLIKNIDQLVETRG